MLLVEPDDPSSIVVMEMAAVPLKLATGLNVSPLNAALILAVVPLNTIVLLLEPVPVEKDKPVVPLKDIAPLVDVRVTVMVPVAASLTLIKLPLAVLKIRAVSSLMV